MGENAPRRKLIEVSIPLEAINAAAVHEKSIRHGHPSTLHLWWARRPLAACRAVLFAQLVDDPSSWPDRFPTPQAQAAERDRLHGIIQRLVPWENAGDEAILDEARWEIARSVAWGRGDEPPSCSDGPAVRAYLLLHAPPVYDPFCGGGSIPLEAQRLGLRAFGSDLNPVAVLISKALLELPPKFAGKPPVNPDAQTHSDLVEGGWLGVSGLAEDVRYYGSWMRERAAQRIGHLYLKSRLPNGTEATTIAWIWARTVRSPDPMARGAHVPLVSSFMLSEKRRIQAWVEPVIDQATHSYCFRAQTGILAAADRARLKRGTKSSRGYFACILTGAPISYEHVDSEANSGRMSVRLMAVVAETKSARVYLAPTEEHERAARAAVPHWSPCAPCRGTFASNAQGRLYGFASFGDYFTPRQLVALTTFADLIEEARQQILTDGRQAGRHDPGYADAVATYLAFALSKLADRGSSICTWFTERDSTRPTFARPAIPMTWDFAELNTVHTGTGSFEGAVAWTAESLEHVSAQAPAAIIERRDAREHADTICSAVISTDPPYYDNISYSDLSDFFYVWLQRALGDRRGRPALWPDLLATPLTPKDAELIASPYRHGGKTGAGTFFINGMSKAISAMRRTSDSAVPITIYYAFKQSESVKEGMTSPGWASFLQAVADSGLTVAGTWPLRTELNNRMIGIGTNALASSIVLVCRVRAPTASVIERETFVRALRRELPTALAAMCTAGISPVDLAQSLIGPGMGIFTRHAAVLEDSGRNMTVRTALALINQVLDDIGADDDAAYDLATRFALDWFQEAGWDARPSGEAILAANARNLAITQLVRSGLIATEGGKTRLVSREEMPRRGAAFMRPMTTWQATQQLARALTSENGGIDTAAAMMARIAEREPVRAMAYRLYGMCDRRGWAAEALVWNRLAEEWRTIAERAGRTAPHVARDLFELRA